MHQRPWVQPEIRRRERERKTGHQRIPQQQPVIHSFHRHTQNACSVSGVHGAQSSNKQAHTESLEGRIAPYSTIPSANSTEYSHANKTRHWECSHEVSKDVFKVSLGYKLKTCLMKPKLAGQTKPESAKDNKLKQTKGLVAQGGVPGLLRRHPEGVGGRRMP